MRRNNAVTATDSSCELGVEVAALGERHDAIGGTKRQRHDGHGRLAAAGGDQAAAIAEEKIFYVVSLVIGIDDGSFGILAHTTGAEQVDTELLLVDWESPFLLGTCGIKKFRGTSCKPMRELQIVRMILVSQAERGKPPGVFHVGIDRETIIFNGQGSAVAKNFKAAGKIVGECCLELLTPARSSSREGAERKSDGRHIESGIESAAAVEADFLCVEFVEIVKDAADGETFVVVELLIEKPERNAAGVEHEILADVAARVGEAVGKLF